MCGQQHVSPPFIHSKSRMRKRARTDLRGGRSAMVVPTATVGGSCVVPTERSKRALGVLIERFTLLFEFSFRDGGGFLQGFFDAAGAGFGGAVIENSE